MNLSWVLLVAALLQTPPASPAGKLRVQLVEPGWLPVPTTTVKMRRVTDCASSERRTTGTGQEKLTDRLGWTEFDVEQLNQYLIEVDAQGGFAAAKQCVRLLQFNALSHTAYVQIRLAPRRFIEVR
jgi:hypothetical protein